MRSRMRMTSCVTNNSANRGAIQGEIDTIQPAIQPNLLPKRHFVYIMPVPLTCLPHLDAHCLPTSGLIAV